MTTMPADPTPAEGVVVVPVEPTEAMLEAGYLNSDALTAEDVVGFWTAMLSARPAAPTQSAAQTGEVECEVCKRGEVRHFSMDDGFWVEITTSAGGANEHGLNGWIETLEHYPDGLTKRREYVATDSPALSTIPARPAAPTQSAAQTGEVDAILIEAQAAEIEVLRAALEPFVQHGRACGALADADNGPFWIMTDTGHRDIPAEDFRRAFLASRTERADG